MPNMPKIRNKKRRNSSTFTSCPSDLMRDTTWFLRLRMLLMALSGRSTLKVLMPRKFGIEGMISIHPTITTMKSSQFHPFLR
jgi:hypothetical protein